jgi:hypothetical protein
MKNLKDILVEKLSIDSISEKLSIDSISLEKEESTDNIEDFKVGDILVSVFSYTMTIVEFFKIVKKSGKKTFYLQPIAREVVSGDNMRGKCAPKQPIEYICDEIRIIGSRDGKLRGGKSPGYRPMYTYTGEPVYFDHMD